MLEVTCQAQRSGPQRDLQILGETKKDFPEPAIRGHLNI